MQLGLIGYGSIASTLAGLLGDDVSLTALARPGRGAAASQALPGATVVEDVEALIAAEPDMVVECAGQAAVRDSVPALLRAGIDVVVVSIGALADDTLHADLKHAATEGGARVILPAGAVGGIDLLSALSASGEAHVRYTGTKPPAAWKGTPAEDKLALDTLAEATVFFKGTAREAALGYPKNANVAATLALAGGGFDRMQVSLVADPAAPGNLHAYAVETPAARYEIRIENKPSTGNVKTSAATIYSVLREIRNRIGPMVI
ncbi:aspartate dehydrogenase [Antarctobacter jejuensis]|uniref:aspartate dehydrogenase n=1 Tax=Antarctobacter jejuensis TaxID=1439938 RepID=UPI003FD5E6CE